MRYAYFREHGMFIGSGTVEAGCKAVVGQRLKLSGMRWTIPGPTGAGHHAVMPHHRRMAFGYGTSVPTRGLGAVIASRNGVGRVEGRRAEAKWLAAAVGTGVLCSAAVS
jgi:hypothetical protein